MWSSEGRKLVTLPPSCTELLAAPRSHRAWCWVGCSPPLAAGGSTSNYPSLHNRPNHFSSVSAVMHALQATPSGSQTFINWLWFVALKMEYDYKKCLHLLIYKLPTGLPCLSTSQWQCAVNWFKGIKSFKTFWWKMLQKWQWAEVVFWQDGDVRFTPWGWCKWGICFAFLGSLRVWCRESGHPPWKQVLCCVT